MTSPTSESQPPPRRAERALPVVVAIVVAAFLAVLGWRTAGRVATAAAAAARGCSETPEARILRTAGIPASLVQAIHEALPEDGRLVLYSPYGGQEFVLDAADPRGEWARQLRGMWGRLKNLLYPRPRDVRPAYDPGELQALVEPGLVGRLLVLDGTQGTAPLTVGGDYELIREELLGAVRMRLWRLRRTP
ncbi:MAG: hypothetical protein H6838_10930 [Planctomycetes bacterium]|nr:hypothetical protein [Planctomycetota bacterium]MCB9886000.1 hypothetical protein [Planctomycetota bacterium]